MSIALLVYGSDVLVHTLGIACVISSCFKYTNSERRNDQNTEAHESTNLYILPYMNDQETKESTS